MEEAYRTRAGTRLNLDWLEVDLQEVVNKVLKRATELVTFVEGRLREKVYTNTEVIRVRTAGDCLTFRARPRRWCSMAGSAFHPFTSKHSKMLQSSLNQSWT